MSSVEMVSLPLLDEPATALYVRLILMFFLASILIGLFTFAVKEGLSILMMNSIGSKKGFLNSMGGGLAPAILKGPLG